MKIISISILILLLLAIDFYVFQAVKTIVAGSSHLTRKVVFIAYWSLTGLSILLIVLYNFGIPGILPNSARSLIITALFINYISKTFGALVLVIDDVVRVAKWVLVQLSDAQEPQKIVEGGISRSEFLSKASLIAASVPLSAMTFGIVSGAHDYRIRRRTIALPHLPAAFDGIRIAQISDIHSGSFFNKKAVNGGVEMLLSENPDMVFFTGDLVNNESDEIEPYLPIFSKIQAPYGVYAVLGNHDYGDYRNWPSKASKEQNFIQLIEAFRLLGWQLLRNEHRVINSGNEQIAVIGVENWGAGRFSKYGDLSKAYRGAELYPVKLLLSHDPSHWDAQVRPEYPDIDVTFSGHTHGFQFGIELGKFRWSPSQYIYEEWADLYQKGKQYIYVNRGFGYLGYPGRIGILPEITLVTLKKA